MRRLSTLICVAALVSACGASTEPQSDEPEEPTVQEPAETEAEVEPKPEEADFWADVPNGDNLRGFIDEDAAAADCEALQETFNTWDAAELDAGVKADLLSYIDEALSGAGCYD